MATLRRPSAEANPSVSGVARLDRRTKRLVGRLHPGDIAIIDHVDLDRVAAEALVAAKVAAVVNAQPSISGRYPNLGPDVIVANGIPLLDNVGSEVFAAVKEGNRVRLELDVLYLGDTPVAKGIAQDTHSVNGLMAEAKSGMSTQLEAFAADTVEYMKRERALLLDGVGVPEITTKLSGRHAVIVVRGYRYQEDLAALKHYIREFQPVLIGVDAGADALHDAGYTPDLIIGDMTGVSDGVLTCGAEVVVRARPDGTAAGLARVQDLNVAAVTFPAGATGEDLAMLLADEKGADLIVAVGTHLTLVEFLDQGRSGAASTFLTRLRVGGKLVDAQSVSKLYRSRISAGALLLLVGAALLAIVAALAVSDSGRAYLDMVGARLGDFVDWIQGLFS
jgi:uncharacterized membrane-anchored protein